MARPVHSHYDNLKVARNAPAEVIRAAYRTLAKQYHPDQNPSPDAARVMKLLNAAWEVLGDPVQRQQHDVWIAEQEHAQATASATAQAATFQAGPRSGAAPHWARAAASPAPAPTTLLDAVLDGLRHARRRHLVLLGTGVTGLLALVMLFLTLPSGAQWSPEPQVKAELHPLPPTAAEVGHPLHPMPVPASSPLPSSTL